MCEPGRLWSDLYFEWMNHCPVIFIMLSENYFCSPACRAEFENAVVKQVPDINDKDRIVIPLVVSELSFKYPTDDPVLTNNSDPDLQAFCDLALKELGQRNCFPNPADGPFIGGSKSFEQNMAELINVVAPYVQRWHR